MFQRNNNKRNISMILLRTKKKKGEKKMKSIQTQNQNNIYYQPTLNKAYIKESVFDKKCEVRAVIDGDDCLLGMYTTMKQAKQVLVEITNAVITPMTLLKAYSDKEELIYRVPEDKGEYR